MKSVLTSDWGPALHRFSRQLAVPVVATYVAGEMAGLWVHRLNDRLAAGWAGFLLRAGGASTYQSS